MQRRQWSPPPSVPRSGDGRCDGDVRPLRKPSPRQGGGRGYRGQRLRGDLPPPEAASPPAKRSQETINLLALDDLMMNSLNCLLVFIIQAEFLLINAALCTSKFAAFGGTRDVWPREWQQVLLHQPVGHVLAL